jgi:hypothetical protein
MDPAAPEPVTEAGTGEHLHRGGEGQGRYRAGDPLTRLGAGRGRVAGEKAGSGERAAGLKRE